MNASNVRMGGGIVQVILNYKKALEEDLDVNLEFAINTDKDSRLPEYLGIKEGKFHLLPNKKKNLIGYIKELNKVLKRGYDCVHVHGSSSTMVIELLCAAVVGIPVRIAHSHNSKSDYPVINYLINPVFRRSYTKAVACSKLAGDWIFKPGNFEIIRNGIDCERYRFQEEARIQIREDHGIENGTKVIGHIGNFVEQKNHEFIIEVFAEYSKNNDARLFLVGDGELKEAIKAKVCEMELSDKVVFWGLRDDVERLLQAMDCFILPSKWEGLPLVALEAQAAGLPCMFSDMISEEVCVNNSLCQRVPLKKEEWVEALDRLNLNTKRIEAADIVKAKGYDIADIRQRLLDLYEVGDCKWI